MSKVHKFTKTHRFILPLVTNIDKNNSNIINTYIHNGNIVVKTNTLINDFPVSQGSTIIDFKESDDYNYFIITIPELFEEDFILFLEGKYSKMSKVAKLAICNFNRTSADITDNDYYKILYKTPERKQFLEEFLNVTLPEEAELYSIINIEEETIDEW